MRAVVLIGGLVVLPEAQFAVHVIGLRADFGVEPNTAGQGRKSLTDNHR